MVRYKLAQNLFLKLVAGLICIVSIQSCVPVFSELQSARTVGKDRVEFTPSYSNVTSRDQSDVKDIQSHLGVQAAYGITSNIDLKLRYEFITPKDGISKKGIHVIGVGEKFSLVKDRIAFSLMIGRALESKYDKTWQMHPSLLFTIPAIKDKLDFNLSSKYIVQFAENDDLLAFNFGVSVSNNLKKWSIRPEYGALYNPGNKGHYSHVSIGFSYSLGTVKEEN